MTTPDCTTPLKRCTKCGREFPFTPEFFHWKSKTRLRSNCKQCACAISKARRERPDVAASTAKYRQSDEYRKHRNATRPSRKRTIDRPALLTEEEKIERERKRQHAYYLAHKEQSRAKKRNRRAAAGRHNAADIEAIRKAQGNRCYICHKKLTGEYHVDHFIPIKLGGTNDPGNLRLACPDCNRRKHTTHPHDLGLLI